MSANRTLLLTTENEHWYEDMRKESIFIEVSGAHEITKMQDGVEIEIKKGSPLYNALKSAKFV